MMDPLDLPHGRMTLPIYLPDATRAVVRGVDSADLEAGGIEALVMNTFHLMQNPGSSTIKALGGLHRMAGWDRPIITDSGGFQVYSLIRQNPKYGSISNRGATFRTDAGDRKYNLTPEKSIQLQLGYGADVVICLDDPTHVDDPAADHRPSVRRTVDWARRCKAEFERGIRAADGQRPLLFAVVQGGGDHDLRRECAEALLEIGFDGYGYGGWPLDADNNLLTDILSLTRDLIPAAYPLHALGVGHPANITRAYELGYGIFDSAMPTRDARGGRLYTFTEAEPFITGSNPADWFAYAYVTDDKHIKTNRPVSEHCDCLTCRRYTVGYLNHLYRINESLFMRLTTIHNLRFMAMLIDRLRRRDRGG